MQNWIYRYPPLETGVLLKRYKRFFADIQLTSGEVITAHCPNTGPMTGVSTPGSLVKVSRSDSPKRKLPYTWEMIQVEDNEPTWVGVNTALPNRVIKLALQQRLFPELVSSYNEICCEVPYGKELKSRVDFLLKTTPTPLRAATEELALCDRIEPPIYLEVKSVTLSQGHVALFPDTVTTRGQKHLRELMALLPQSRAVMLYFINRGDCLSCVPADSYDPVYGQLLREAVLQGVEVLPCRFAITPEGIRYLGLAEFLPMQPPVMAKADVPLRSSQTKNLG
ncbi:DNA/RNA nuclease SfsA [Microcoleus sp. FACHB-53]|nr:DNA/RNA nuclease SfsA [Microcoleus sp. FACHB-53]